MSGVYAAAAPSGGQGYFRRIHQEAPTNPATPVVSKASVPGSGMAVPVSCPAAKAMLAFATTIAATDNVLSIGPMRIRSGPFRWRWAPGASISARDSA